MSTIVEQSKSVSGVQLLNIRIQRSPESGLRISLQSDEKYWQTLRRTDGSTCEIGGVMCYKPKADRLQGVPGYFTLDNVWNFEECPNLTMLLAVDLNREVHFNFGEVPVSEKRLHEWVEVFNKQVKTIYLAYIKPTDIRVSFTTRATDETYHD